MELFKCSTSGTAPRSARAMLCPDILMGLPTTAGLIGQAHAQYHRSINEG